MVNTEIRLILFFAAKDGEALQSQQKQDWELTVVQTCALPISREDSIHGHHQMVNTKIRLILFFAPKDGEALYSQQKQDWELTVDQIMNSLLPNSDLN